MLVFYKGWIQIKTQLELIRLPNLEPVLTPPPVSNQSQTPLRYQNKGPITISIQIENKRVATYPNPKVMLTYEPRLSSYGIKNLVGRIGTPQMME